MYIDTRTRVGFFALVAALLLLFVILPIWGINSSPSATSTLKADLSESEAVEAMADLSIDDGVKSSDDLEPMSWGDNEGAITTKVNARFDRKAFGVLPLGHPDKEMCLTYQDGQFHLHDFDGGLVTGMFETCSPDYDEWWVLATDGTWVHTSKDAESERKSENW